MSAGTPTVRVSVNGEPRELPDGSTVADLASALALTPGRFAVEIDGAVVPRSTHAERVLRPDERVEIVTFVGGG